MWPVKVWWVRFRLYYWLAFGLLNYVLSFAQPFNAINIVNIGIVLWCGWRIGGSGVYLYTFWPVYAKCRVVFGSKEAANRWLCEPNVWFAGVKPLDILRELGGQAKVMEHLDRLDNDVLM